MNTHILRQMKALVSGWSAPVGEGVGKAVVGEGVGEGVDAHIGVPADCAVAPEPYVLK
jgi:hypothetical protein